MIFEVVAPTPDGPVEVCGGGRYDGLARVFGSSRDDRGVGFAFGLERVDSILQAQGNRPQARKTACFLIVPSSTENLKAAVQVAGSIRSQGLRAVLEAGWEGESVGIRARSLGATRSINVGDRSLTLIDHAQKTARPITLDEVTRLAMSLAVEAQP